MTVVLIITKAVRCVSRVVMYAGETVLLGYVEYIEICLNLLFSVLSLTISVNLQKRAIVVIIR
jgi:hypothetical protein